MYDFFKTTALENYNRALTYWSLVIISACFSVVATETVILHQPHLNSDLTVGVWKRGVLVHVSFN